MSDKERLQAVIDHLNLNAFALSRKLGLSKADRIYNVLKERNGISTNLAMLITSTFPEISFMYLTQEKGDMITNSIAIKSDRLAAIIDWSHLNIRDFCSRINHNDMDGILRIINNRTDPPSDILKKVLKTYQQINPEWLLLGEGDMFRKISIEEMDNIDYKALYKMCAKTLDLMEEKVDNLEKEIIELKSKIE